MTLLSSGLGGIFDPLRETLDWEWEVLGDLKDRVPWRGISFVAAWEVQSQLSTITLIALVTLTSLLPALAVMLVWAVVAAVVYCIARNRGLPDLLDETSAAHPAQDQKMAWVLPACLTFVKAWLAGLQAFVYSRTVCRMLTRPAKGWIARMARMGIVGIGLTLFGVPAAHHILRKAGYSDARVLRLSLMGPFLNVPYRILLSALVVNAVLGLARPPFI